MTATIISPLNDPSLLVIEDVAACLEADPTGLTLIPPGHVATFKTRDEWLLARQTGIGGSEAAAVMGLSPYNSPLQVFALKRGAVDPPDFSDNEAVQWGKKLEPLIAQHYADQTGRIINVPHGRWHLRRSADHPILLATIDSLVTAPNGATPPPASGDGIVDIKNVGLRMSGHWKEEPPLEYQVQLMHYLLTWEKTWGSLAALVGGQQFRWADLARNDKFVAMLVRKVEEFWERVQLGNAPTASGIDHAVLAALHPEEKVSVVVTLDAEADEMDDRRWKIDAVMGALKKEKKEIDAKLKQQIGDAETGQLPGGDFYTLKTVEVAEHTVKASRSRRLRRFKGG